MTPTEHVEVVYCDDIREEIGGKQSLIGVYSGDMIVSQMPVTLPKLAIFVALVCPLVRKYDHFEVRVERDNETILTSGRIASTDLPNPAPNPQLDSDESAHHMRVGIAFLISPFVIDKPTKLRVVVDTDRGQLRTRALRVYASSDAAKPEPILG